MPKIISGNGHETKSYVVLKWVGIVANALFPILEVVFAAVNAHQLAQTHNADSSSVGWVYNLLFCGVIVLWNVLGCMLITSILTIRKFLKKRNDDGKAINL